MSNLLTDLHDDHKNFIKLLRFIERQLAHIEHCDVVDLEIILIAMQYMRDYPDAVHHPHENLVFDYFLEHYPDHREVIKRLIKEHKTMPVLTEKIIDMLESAVMETPISRETLCQKLHEYINTQKEHMDLEESDVYPLLNNIMQESDWQSIQNKLTDTKDPVFHEPDQESYHLLLHKINSSI